MQSKNLEASGIDTEAIEAEIHRIDEEYKQHEAESEPDYNTNQTGRKFDLEKVVLELEKIGNKFIEQKLHKDLAFSDDELELHSEMLSFVLEKNFSIDTLKNTPEYILAAQSALMGAAFYRKYSELKSEGEL